MAYPSSTTNGAVRLVCLDGKSGSSAALKRRHPACSPLPRGRSAIHPFPDGPRDAGESAADKAISKLAACRLRLARDSGKHAGFKRITRGGRASVREILFMVASVAGRYEPDFIAFQQRLQGVAASPRPQLSASHWRTNFLVRLNAKARQVRQQIPAACSPAVAVS